MAGRSTASRAVSSGSKWNDRDIEVLASMSSTSLMGRITERWSTSLEPYAARRVLG
jgi:hypothetical protein